MKIAIVDTGLDPRYYDNFCDDLSINYYIDGEWKLLNNSDIISDNYGHGTAVFSVVSKMLPNDIEYYLMKVEDSDGCISSCDLTDALRILSDEVCPDVICVAVSSVNEHSGYSESMEKICNELFQKGTIIVAPYCNDNNEIGEPASFKSVVAVVNDIESDISAKELNGSVVIVENVGDEYIPSCNLPEFRGNSLACAIATVKISKIIANGQNGGFDEIVKSYNDTVYLSNSNDYGLSEADFMKDLEVLNCNRFTYRNIGKYFFEKYSNADSAKKIPKFCFCYCYLISDILLMINGDLKR